MPKCQLSNAADKDLSDIYVYTYREFGELQADAYFESLEASDVFVLTKANGLGGAPAWIRTTVTNPQPRDFHSSASSPATNRMITFGGGLAFFETAQNDTRVLSNADGTVTPSTWSTLPISGALPGPRESHSGIYDAANDRMTIFAGTHLITTCCPGVALIVDICT